jgi:hypothetical protein
MTTAFTFHANDDDAAQIDDWLDDDSPVSEQLRAVVLPEVAGPSSRKRHSRAVYDIEVTLSLFQARIVAHRLWRAGAMYPSDSNARAETRWLSRRVMDVVTHASDEDTDVVLELSEFEARVIGDRLHEAAEDYDCEHITQETRRLRDVFHDACETRQS